MKMNRRPQRSEKLRRDRYGDISVKGHLLLDLKHQNLLDENLVPKVAVLISGIFGVS